jgi:hypothetical protein
MLSSRFVRPFENMNLRLSGLILCNRMNVKIN